MIHEHWPLGDGVKRIFVFINARLFQRLVIKRQGAEVFSQALSLSLFWREYIALTLTGHLKAAQGLAVNFNDYRLRGFRPAIFVGVLQIIAVGKAKITHRRRQFFAEEAFVFNVSFPLLRIGAAA